jgi:hypothetical protein
MEPELTDDLVDVETPAPGAASGDGPLDEAAG